MTESELKESIVSLLGSEADRVAAGATLQRIGALTPESMHAVLITLAENAVLLASSDQAILGGLLLAVQQLAAKDMALMAISPGQQVSNQHASGSEQFRSTTDLATGSGGAGGRGASKLASGIQLEGMRRLSELDAGAVQRIAEDLPLETPNRHRLLYLLAANRSSDALQVLAGELANRPPGRWTEVGQVLSPLMQQVDWEPRNLFPRVLDGLSHPSVASPMLDLSNYLLRSGRTPIHPAESRRESLVGLLGAVVGRLAKFEEDPHSMGDSVDAIQKVLGEAVALAVSLCDALGLIGWDGSVGKLYQAMELKHRRVQCEAAGALARLGVEDGRKRLIELAAEPAARLRVIAYAEELGFEGQIDDAYKTNDAGAEADMALWLSQPANMGVPPTSVEVIDHRLQFWPSFEQPIDCYLVRFEYHFGDRVYSNIGISGPAVFSLGADLADLPTEDIYAVYAGWQVEHEDIGTFASAKWNSAQRRLAKPLIEELDRQGFESIQPALLCFFLDEHALVATANRHDTECLVITDGLETIDFSTQGRLRPMTADDVWFLYLGRKMLRTFNP